MRVTNIRNLLCGFVLSRFCPFLHISILSLILKITLTLMLMTSHYSYEFSYFSFKIGKIVSIIANSPQSSYLCSWNEIQIREISTEREQRNSSEINVFRAVDSENTAFSCYSVKNYWINHVLWQLNQMVLDKL